MLQLVPRVLRQTPICPDSARGAIQAPYHESLGEKTQRQGLGNSTAQPLALRFFEKNNFLGLKNPAPPKMCQTLAKLRQGFQAIVCAIILRKIGVLNDHFDHRFTNRQNKVHHFKPHLLYMFQYSYRIILSQLDECIFYIAQCIYYYQ